MSVIATRLPPIVASSALGMRVLAKILQHTVTVIQAWRTRIRQRSELLMLDAVELRELSLTEAGINREASKPFWENIRLNHSGR